MKVTLLGHLPLRTIGDINHVHYNFRINNISRAVLQQLARHKYLVGMSVESTRYTLVNKLKKRKSGFGHFSYLDETETIEPMIFNVDRKEAGEFIKLTGIPEIDDVSIMQLNMLYENIQSNVKLTADMLKYNIPECFLTSLAWTIQHPSLVNFLKLRTAPSAFLEIRELANAIYEAIPAELKDYYTQYIYKKPN